MESTRRPPASPRWELLCRRLTELLEAHSAQPTRNWWQNYVKDAAPFLGVKMADIRSSLHRWHRDNVEGAVEPADELDLALRLVFGEHSEEKLTGILYLQEILIPRGVVNGSSHVERLAGLFAEGGIYDWNVCDWFCVKVLGPLIRQHGMSCARRIAAWRTADNLWQARSSLVAFVGLADEPAFYPLIAEGCRIVGTREERFAKTAIGWILREVSRHERGFVHGMVEELLPLLTVESLRNATKYLGEADRKGYMRKFKSLG